MKKSATWLLVIVVASLPLTTQARAASHLNGARLTPQFSSEPGVYLTPYRLNREPPAGLEEFDNFNLQRLPGREREREISTDARGDAPVGGALHTKNGAFNFKQAKLIKYRGAYEKLTFTTETVHGVSYTFDGYYLKDMEESNGQYITLKGRLIRYYDGRKVASGELNLYQWVEL